MTEVHTLLPAPGPFKCHGVREAAIWPLSGISAILRSHARELCHTLSRLKRPVSQDTDESWLQITLQAGADEGEAMADALWNAGALSVAMEDAADDPVYEPAPGESPLWPHTAVVGLFDASGDPQQILRSVQQALALQTPPHARVTSLAGREWETAWRKDFHAMPFGERLWVCPRDETAPGNAVTVNLEPGLAFGTGTHPSTALCLEWLDGHIEAGDRVIDYGCGSGILGIAAAKLGAAQVWAVDTDPQALQATRGNAETNGVAHLFRISAPDDLPTVEADCLIANILAQPLIALAPRFAALLGREARLVVAGILREQAEAVASALEPDFRVTGRAVREPWVRIDAARR